MNASERLTVALAQVNLLVGDVQGNLALTLREAARARDELRADLVLFPELTLSGYPPEDLLFHRGLRTQIERAVRQVAGGAPGIDLVLGFPEYQGNQIYNSAGVYRDGRRVALRRKSCLPNYRVFDEKRYFTAGEGAAVFECKGFRLGLLVCEDAWESEPARLACAAGAELLLVINAWNATSGPPATRRVSLVTSVASSRVAASTIRGGGTTLSRSVLPDPVGLSIRSRRWANNALIRPRRLRTETPYPSPGMNS